MEVYRRTEFDFKYSTDIRQGFQYNIHFSVTDCLYTVVVFASIERIV
jgi:hypothetical protein